MKSCSQSGTTFCSLARFCFCLNCVNPLLMWLPGWLHGNYKPGTSIREELREDPLVRDPVLSLASPNERTMGLPNKAYFRTRFTIFNSTPQYHSTHQHSTAHQAHHSTARHTTSHQPTPHRHTTAHHAVAHQAIAHHHAIAHHSATAHNSTAHHITPHKPTPDHSTPPHHTTTPHHLWYGVM
jgi:hypothetical protein